MELGQQKIAVISHASIREINRSVYRYLQESVGALYLVIPSKIQLKSNAVLVAEPKATGDPLIFPMELKGKNPRTYSYPSLLSWLDQTKPTVILLENDPVSKLGNELFEWCRKNNAKIICQTYENIKRDVFSTLRNQGIKHVPKNLLIQLLNLRAASKIDCIFVVNKESEFIFNNYGYKKVVRIPLGYDPKVFFYDSDRRQLYRKKLRVPENTLLVGYFGRLINEKGVHILIQALSKLKALNWSLLLDHAHDNENMYTAYIKKMIAHYGLESRVIYFEADHREIADYMRATDIMVAPSLTTSTFKEQYGRTVQEAMACGCITLVSDSGNLKDLVGVDEIVFKEGDAAKLQELLRSIMQDEILKNNLSVKLKNRAKTNLTSEFQANIVAKVIKDFYPEEQAHLNKD